MNELYNEHNMDSHKKKVWWWVMWMPSIFSILIGFVFTSFIIAQNYSAQSNQDEEFLQLFENVYALIKQEYVDVFDSKELVYGAVRGMLDTLDDPYSRFLDEDELAQLQTTLSGTFGGLGMYIGENRSSDPDRKYIQIMSPIDNTPAFHAGFRAGDLITQIDERSTLDMDTETAVSLLRGTPGTTVDLTILRGKNYSFTTSVTRKIIEIPSIRSALLPENIKYIRVLSFSILTGETFQKELYDKDYKGLIIDLRGNGGGLLRGAVDMVDVFFSDGVIVSLKGRDKQDEKVYYATKNQLVPSETPIIVLVDQWSASASEILAGALKDRSRGLVIGEKTYGKGSVQEINSFNNIGVRLTTAKYYTPSGKNIDSTGIEVDILASNPELDDNEIVTHTQIAENGLIADFVINNPEPSPQEIEDFLDQLMQDYDNLDEWYIRRNIQSELFRVQHNETPVYNLEFDIPLQKAVELITTGEAAILLQNAN